MRTRDRAVWDGSEPRSSRNRAPSTGNRAVFARSSVPTWST